MPIADTAKASRASCLLVLCCPLAGVQINAAQWCFSGFMAGFTAFEVGSFPGIIFMVGGGAWAVLAVISLWVLKDVSGRLIAACLSVWLRPCMQMLVVVRGVWEGC
jgi:hypothetical protein